MGKYDGHWHYLTTNNIGAVFFPSPANASPRHALSVLRLPVETQTLNSAQTPPLPSAAISSSDLSRYHLFQVKKMGSQTLTTGDRSRTYWTQTMERYFIDLMLDEMQKGNRVGHTFNKQAWTDMLAVFNLEFGSQYDKDVLKSRYTNLWKQFNDIKNLLNHGGFSWDESRQMVIAEDYVWDEYVKAHPDVRSYKTKVVMNFNDLCLIYGYTTADGRYSRSSHDLDFEDEIQAVNMGDGIVSLASSSTERSRTDWTPSMDQYFIELMVDQLERGNKIENTFNKQAWTEMLSLFNAKFGPQHGKRVLRHRYKKLWKYYTDISGLLKLHGFSWDERQQSVTADDVVWDAYIKAHPNARSYRKKCLPNYKVLGSVYGDAIDSNGNHINFRREKDYQDDIYVMKAGDGKESQASTAGDRSRTYWTPPMDRYLIELLVEQVHKGNKLAQTFITQAWIDMVTLFNAKFGSRHDKDVLKNRYKHFRKLYNDVTVLLEQNGFSWDEAREMVTATDSVWDAYTKAHPDARTYRVKTVPSYNKLCIIYGLESCDGRYSLLARNTCPDGESPVLMTGEEINEQFPYITSPLTLFWSPPMDRYFIDLMLGHVHGGNKIVHTLNERAWAQMITSFNEKFGVQCDKFELENRYMCLMRECSDITRLLNHTGFSWDETRQMVLADDIAWEDYTKENPEAISYKDKYLETYNSLCVIYGIGRFHCDDVQIEINHNTSEMEIDEISRDLQSLVQGTEMTVLGKKRQAAMLSPSERSIKSHRTGHAMVQDDLGLNEEKNYISIESAMNALQAIQDIDYDLLLEACDLLEDERKAKTFMALDQTLRKKWLLRKLRSQ